MRLLVCFPLTIFWPPCLFGHTIYTWIQRTTHHAFFFPACSETAMADTLVRSGPRRHGGKIVMLRDVYGFIRPSAAGSSQMRDVFVHFGRAFRSRLFLGQNVSFEMCPESSGRHRRPTARLCTAATLLFSMHRQPRLPCAQNAQRFSQGPPAAVTPLQNFAARNRVIA